jgi:hypothetical protein
MAESKFKSITIENASSVLLVSLVLVAIFGSLFNSSTNIDIIAQLDNVTFPPTFLTEPPTGQRPASQLNFLAREERSLRIIEEDTEVICKSPVTSNRPIFIFIVGAEGTGHHLLAGLFSRLPHVFVLPKVHRQYFAEIWEPTLDEERRYEKKQELVSMLTRISRKVNVTHYLVQSPFEMYSFPYDDPRNHLRRPDLIELISIIEPIFDLRVIVTLRDESNSIASLVRRNFWSLDKCQKGVMLPTNPSLYTSWPLGPCGYVGLQAKVVEDSLIFMSSQLEVISWKYYRTLYYEDYLAAPLSYVKPLAKFFGYRDWRALLKVTRRYVRPHKEDYTELMSDVQKDLIAKTFSSTRLLQWAYLLRDDLELSASIPPKLPQRRERCFQEDRDQEDPSSL